MVIILVVIVIAVVFYFAFNSSGISNEDFCRLCEKGSASEIREALRSGARVNGTDKLGFSPLMAAAIKNPSVEAITELLDAGASLWYVNNGHTVLHNAVNNPNPEVVRLLLDAGLYEAVNARTKLGDTPLIWGVQWGMRPEVIEMLAEAGANLNARNYQGCSPLVYAISFYECNNAAEMIPALIKAGANVNDLDNPQRVAPLIRAVCSIKDEAIIEALIKGGADVNLRDARGATAMDYAVYCKNDAAVRVLKKYAAR